MSAHEVDAVESDVDEVAGTVPGVAVLHGCERTGAGAARHAGAETRGRHESEHTELGYLAHEPARGNLLDDRLVHGGVFERAAVLQEMQLQAVVRGVERVVVALLLLRARHGDLREDVLGAEPLVHVEREQLLVKREVGITPDRAGEVRITRLPEPEVKLGILQVGRTGHGAQEPRQDHRLAVVVRDGLQEVHAGGPPGGEVAGGNAERLGDECLELRELLGIGFRVDAEEPAHAAFNELVRDRRIRCEHALLDDAVGGARGAAQEPGDLVRGFVAEHAYLRHVDPEELLVFRAPAAHLVHELVQELDVLGVLTGPPLRAVLRRVQELLHGVVVEAAVHFHERVDAARGEDLPVAQADFEDHAVGWGEHLLAEADLRGERLRQHRQELAGEIRGEGPLECGFVEPGAGADPCGHVGDMDAERDLAGLVRGHHGDRVVEIVRVRRVDRERVQRGKVFAFDPDGRELRGGGFLLGRIRRAEAVFGRDGVQVSRDFAGGTERTLHAAAELFRMACAVVQQPHLHPVALFGVAGGGVHADGLREVLVERAYFVGRLETADHELTVVRGHGDDAADGARFPFRVRRVAFVRYLLDFHEVAV